VACALLAPLCMARGASAQISWQGTERCGPSAEQVAAAERALSDPGAPRVEVALSQHDTRWTAKLQASYANGSIGVREISARSCAQLLRGVSVAVSLLEPTALDADGSVAEHDRDEATLQSGAFERATPEPETPAPKPVLPERAPPPPASPPPASPPPAGQRAAAPVPASVLEDAGAQPSVRAQRASSDWSLRVSSLLGLAGNSTPELGAALSAAAWWQGWGTRVGLSARQPVGLIRAEHEVSVDLQRFDSSLELCARTLRALRWGLCAGPRLEIVRGMSLGPSSPASDLIWLPELGAASWLSFPVTERWALSAELRSSWSARRAFARVAPWGRVYELPQLDSALLIGAEWSL
jgi:hypothetical protein